MTDKPNILFVIDDEHRFDVLGCYGNEIVRTPNLDRLAEDAVIFDNAYTPSPVCIPARQCIASGQYPMTCGVTRYGQDLPPNSITFPRRLVENGYMATVSGKLHHMGPDQMQGWSKRVGGDMEIQGYFLHEMRSEENKHLDLNAVRSVKWSDAKEILRAGIGRGPAIDFDLYALQGALLYIERYFSDPFYDRPKSLPLLLKTSFLQPHYPYFTDETKFTYYLNRVEPYLDQTLPQHPVLQERKVIVGEDVNERDMRRATAAYYGMIESVDEYVGQLIDALEHAGQDIDDWVIIFTTDHGEMLGQHSVWEKRRFYEASARVPLIIRYPKRFATGRVQENVNLVDLFATLCDLTDAPIPDGLDSRSLVPLMEGDSSGWDNETLSQLHDDNLMIKRDDLKYQWYGVDLPEVLFDLARDPSEETNFIGDARYANDVATFRERAKALGYPVGQ